MRRADRLIELVGRLRAGALTRAEDLAAALEVSIRTVYRDIAALQAQGLPIEGQAGVGYLLRGPVDLPPSPSITTSLRRLRWASPTPNRSATPSSPPPPAPRGARSTGSGAGSGRPM